MLVTRQFDTEQTPWSINKYEANLHKSTTTPRMSNNFDTPLSTQSDWQGQYSFLPPGDNTIFAQPFDHVSGSNDTSGSQAQPRSAAANDALDISPKTEHNTLRSPLGHRRSLDPLGLRQQRPPSPITEQPEQPGDIYTQKSGDSVKEESLVSTDTPGLSLGSNPLSSVSSAGQGPDMTTSQGGADEGIAKTEDDDEVIDDDDMIEGEGELSTQPQTAAERTAARRKMKRFRLTHQQTRFLMSEFAKQPHPDAAHRERLSREIPGLSPRQVQVWFQNRRAKIKRLTADDRDRMIKMRAVPDDFDNVQALHSPYGAVHGLGTPLTSPVDFGASSYADHMMRPLMVDVRRAEGDDHLSPTGLSPAFGSIGFNPAASMSSSDILSPLSPNSNDRYVYSSHLSTPLSAGPRTSNPFARQNSLDSSMQMHSHHQRQQIRPLQPLQLRETMSRSRSDNLQSPLRSSMSWKGDSIDYSTYHGGSGSPQLGGRQQSVYQSDTSTTLGGYESSTYSGSTVQSPTHMSYPNFSSSSLSQNQNRSRLRAASATLPLGLDLRTQFRSVGSGQGLQSSAHSPTHRSASTSLSGVSSSYTTSFPSAPLTAPIDYSLPRTPGFRSSGHDYSMPQMSAPIAPPNDFSQAFQASLGSSSTRTPMRDTFGGGPLSLGQSHGSNDRSDDYSSEGIGAGMKRKRSFTLPQAGSATPGASQAYGSTT